MENQKEGHPDSGYVKSVLFLQMVLSYNNEHNIVEELPRASYRPSFA